MKFFCVGELSDWPVDKGDVVQGHGCSPFVKLRTLQPA